VAAPQASGILDQLDLFKTAPQSRSDTASYDTEPNEDDEYSEDEEFDEEEPIRIRKRGESDAVDFTLERGALDGEMVKVGIKEVAVRLGGRLVIQDASWVVQTGDKLALVGPNGCGKTTQLRILTGDLEADAGEVIMSSNKIKMAVMNQSFVDELDLERSLEDEVMSAIPKQRDILHDLREVEEKLEAFENDEEKPVELIERLMELQALSDQYRVHEVEPRLNGILGKAGFLKEDLDQRVGVFSGGWKVRIGLAKIFMTAPDVLLLDEPTNHLDLNSVEWLETFLQNQELPIVVVSHDREFMDRVCNKIVDTAEGMTYSYTGNYSQFIEQREEKMRIWKMKYRQQQKDEVAMMKYIKVNKGKQAMANAVMRRQKELDNKRLNKDWLDPPPRLLKRIKFNFPDPPLQRRGAVKQTTMAAMNQVLHGYGDGQDAVLFEEATMSVDWGEKIGIVGGNGVGKSTLLRVLMGLEKPKSGTVLPAEINENCYFTQHQADLLPQQLTTLEAVEEANGMGMGQKDLIEIMSKFRFKGKRLAVNVGQCSGGEKARLAIVRMMLTPSQMLILDEPTNHLDVTMKETLEYSLREFPGAAVIVSHDRYFLSQTCKSILEVKDGQIRLHKGDFRSYMESDRELRKQIEGRYSGTSAGIMPLQMSQDELKDKERGGLRKYVMKRKMQAQVAARTANNQVLLSR